MAKNQFWVLFDNKLGPQGSVFVEVENDEHESVKAGRWEDDFTGYARLGPFVEAEEHDKLVAVVKRYNEMFKPVDVLHINCAAAIASDSKPPWQKRLMSTGVSPSEAM